MGTRAPDRAFRHAFALIVSATACAIVAIAAPRVVEPARLPALRLDPDQVAADTLRERTLAAASPRGDDIDELLRLYREEGAAELAVGPRDFERLQDRRAALALACRAVFTRVDAEAARALQAHVTSRALAALAGELDEAEARGLLGALPALLVRYGYADPRHGVTAPEPALRAFYKARFNLVCERPPTEGFSRLELLAHEGFRALHVGALPPEQRAASAAVFHALGGRYGEEADAIWRFQGGAREAALAMLRAAHARTGRLRLRNMALYAAQSAD